MSEASPVRPLSELSDAGLLWLINRAVFHPRGFALALHSDGNGVVTGWQLQGDGSEEWSFPPERERDHFQRAEQTLRDAASTGNP
jgi:hypothetical protein